MVEGCRNKHPDYCAGHWQFKTTQLVYKPKQPQNLRPRLYIHGGGYGDLPRHSCTHKCTHTRETLAIEMKSIKAL